MSRYDTCGCEEFCGDDGDIDAPGICRGLARKLEPPLIEFVVIHRDDLRLPVPSGDDQDGETR